MKEAWLRSASYAKKICLWNLASGSGAPVIDAHQVFELGPLRCTENGLYPLTDQSWGNIFSVPIPPFEAEVLCSRRPKAFVGYTKALVKLIE
ncbi:histone-binding protein MSI1-like [Panicum miliaceum]|uniref:Histone-binding protein MSI1-like n=1 Tax=Panicum miliaceum TaxID=4540 RepID=A0A3L6SZ93_PANMI|nr:histone-binding protein MSI1-like [Panicum miliaceum]